MSTAGIPKCQFVMVNSLDEPDAAPPIEDEAQFEKVVTDQPPRMSNESTESTRTNSLDNIGRLSLSSEDTDTHVVVRLHKIYIDCRTARL